MPNNGRGNRIQFEAHLRIVPERGEGKRFEIQRSRQKIAHLVHRDLIDNFATGNIALPGGGQAWGIGDIAGDDSAFSNQVNGTAVKPQFGETPDIVTIVGFFDHTTAVVGSDSDTIPYGERPIIHSGSTHTQSSQFGPAAGAPGWDSDTEPSSAARQIVFALKDDLETAITSITVEILSLEVMGIKWGQGGYTFPLTGTAGP